MASPRPKTFRSLILGLTLGVVAPAALIWLGLGVWADQHYRKYVPEQVPILRLTSHRSEGWYTGCGGAIFSMRPQDSARLHRDGLSAFEDRMIGRGYAANARRPVVWTRWRETEARTNLGDGPHPGLTCLRSPMQDRIVEALMRPGSFTAGSDDRQLIVIPDLNVVVFLFYD
ncbi:hypothetical protein [Brevundimonas sp.]|uniref:hypothetical protein n=1 Tax=Brevundimonas sp. TaxID=1871086 RepID=UPI003F6EC851